MNYLRFRFRRWQLRCRARLLRAETERYRTDAERHRAVADAAIAAHNAELECGLFNIEWRAAVTESVMIVPEDCTVEKLDDPEYRDMVTRINEEWRAGKAAALAEARRVLVAAKR